MDISLPVRWQRWTGLGQIRPEEMQGIPHHLLNICDPTEEFSAGRFYDEAREATRDVLSVGSASGSNDVECHVL